MAGLWCVASAEAAGNGGGLNGAQVAERRRGSADAVGGVGAHESDAGEADGGGDGADGARDADDEARDGGGGGEAEA